MDVLACSALLSPLGTHAPVVNFAVRAYTTVPITARTKQCFSAAFAVSAGWGIAVAEGSPVEGGSPVEDPALGGSRVAAGGTPEEQEDIPAPSFHSGATLHMAQSQQLVLL